MPSAQPPSSELLRASLKDQVSLAGLITDYAAEAFFLMNPKGQVLYMNRCAEGMFGFTSEEVAGQNLHDKIHHSHPDGTPFPMAECILGETYKSGRVFTNHEDVFFRKDGSQVPVACSYAPIREDGKIIAAVLLIQELTENKRIQSALAESERKFKAVADTAPCAIYIHDGAHILYTNAAAEKITGYTRDELLALELWTVVHPEDRELVQQRARERFMGQPSIDRYEYRIVCKDGSACWLDFSGTLVQFGEKRAILGTAFDITQRKADEEALRLSEERFRMMAEQSPLSVQILAPDGRTLRVNPSWEKMFGLTLNMLSSYNILEDQQLVEQGIMPYIRRAFAGEACLIPPIPYVPDRGLYAGQAKWLRAFIYPVKVNGQIREIILSHEDITEQKLAEDALRKTEKLATAGRLAATIAHEINNPLESVTNLIYLARTTNDHKELENYLKLADLELSRVSHIARQTLGFYRDSTYPSECDLAILTGEVIDVYRGETHKKEVKVNATLESALVFGFSGELKQVVSNLLRNAIEATPVRGLITIRTQHINGEARFAITDSGPGIPGNIAGKIFEPFFTTKKDVGTGLGLWVSKEIVEKHGGKLQFNTSPDGTTFEFAVSGLRR